MTNAMKKPGRAGASIHKLDKEQREAMDNNKWAECSTWLEDKICESCLGSVANGPLMNGRWVLTVKDSATAKSASLP